jgi:hypothetical protein
MIEFTVHDKEVLYTFHSLDDLPSPPGDVGVEFEKFSMSESKFREASQRRHDAYEKFRKSLTYEVSTLVLEAFDFSEIQILINKVPELIDRWIELLLRFSQDQSRALKNFGLLLASALTYQIEKIDLALELYDAYENQSPIVQIQYTEAHLPLESLAIWLAADHPQINDRRFLRLDSCQNDHQIAIEVSVALYAEKSEILDAYVSRRLRSSLPVDVARAIMVVGFSDNEERASEVFHVHENHKGLLGEAAKACRFAMDRHRWSKHWFEKMQTAQSPEDFWRLSVLFFKIVDSRFNALHRQTPVGNATFNQSWWSVDRQINNRLKSWVKNREKKLFGSDVPSPIFLS